MHFIHLFSILLPVCFNKFSVQCPFNSVQVKIREGNPENSLNLKLNVKLFLRIVSYWLFVSTHRGDRLVTVSEEQSSSPQRRTMTMTIKLRCWITREKEANIPGIPGQLLVKRSSSSSSSRQQSVVGKTSSASSCLLFQLRNRPRARNRVNPLPIRHSSVASTLLSSITFSRAVLKAQLDVAMVICRRYHTLQFLCERLDFRRICTLKKFFFLHISFLGLIIKCLKCVFFSQSQSAEFVSMCYGCDIAVNNVICTIRDIRCKYLTILVLQLIGISVLVVIFTVFQHFFNYFFFYNLYCMNCTACHGE